MGDRALSAGDVLTLTTPLEGQIGSVTVTSFSEGQLVGRLKLATQETSQAASAFQAADAAAECFSFAAMELEESNLASLGLQMELPDGRTWRLGVDVASLLVTERCTHIAFKLLKAPRIYDVK